MELSNELYKKILNHHFDLVYLLDDKGNYIFANDDYLSMVRMTREELLRFNVHDFLKNKTITKCVSDEVYRTGKQVIMFQDVSLDSSGKEPPIRYIIVSTPIFDENGRITNIFAVMKSVEKLNDAYRQARLNDASCFEIQDEDEEIPEDIIAESQVMRDVLRMVSHSKLSSQGK